MSSLYDKAREGFLSGDIVWKVDGSTIKVVLVRGYTFSASHQFLSEVVGAGGTIVGTGTLGSLTNANGVADAADVVISGVPEGAAIPHLVVYQASAVTGGSDLPASQQRLIVWKDRGSGIPIIPNGQDITIAWSPGADRIFRF